MFFRQKTGTVEDMQKTELKISQKRSSCSLCEIFLVISKNKGLHFNDLRFIAIYRVMSKNIDRLAYLENTEIMTTVP